MTQVDPIRLSAIGDFIRCPLAYRYRHKLHLRKRDDDSGDHHLRFGAAIHEGLSIIYTERNLEKAKAAFKAAYPAQLDPNDLAKTPESGVYMLEKYAEHYDFDRSWEVLSVETTDKSGYVGLTPDLVVRDKTTDSIYIVDHKTTGRYLNFDYFADFDPNSQVTQYIRKAKDDWGHCDGFIVNAISFSYLKRDGKIRRKGLNIEFERQIFNRTLDQIKRTEIDTFEWLEEIANSERRGHWRAAETTNACRFCSYKSLCAAGWSWDEDEPLILTTFRQVCEVDEGSGRCQLDLSHDGAHDPTLKQSQEIEFTVEV